MKKSLATFVKLSVIMCMLSGVAHADFKEHFELGQSYMMQYQYPSAINEFKNALVLEGSFCVIIGNTQSRRC